MDPCGGGIGLLDWSTWLIESALGNGVINLGELELQNISWGSFDISRSEGERFVSHRRTNDDGNDFGGS